MMRTSNVRGAVAVGLMLLAGPPLAETKKSEQQEREGGILGTGILGTVTALGSIEVNGQRVTFGADMMAESPFGAVPASGLRPGAVVVAAVMPDGADWAAERIEDYIALIGPAERTAGEMRILGARVDGANLEPGLWYAVSGLWKGRVLMASQARQIPAQTSGRVAGSYMAGEIGGVAAELDGAVPEGAAVSARVTLEGEVLGYRAGLFAAPVAMVIAEGYLSAPSAQGHYTVLGSGLMAQTDQPSMIDPERRAVFCAAPPVAEGQMARIAPMEGDTCR